MESLRAKTTRIAPRTYTHGCRTTQSQIPELVLTLPRSPRAGFMLQLANEHSSKETRESCPFLDFD